MHGGGSGRQKSVVSVYVGIAALVLEGRVLGGEDEDENFLGINASQNIVVDEIKSERTCSPTASSSSSAARHGVINRISEKLMQIRQFPGTSKDVIETSIVVPVSARDECEYESQPRLHHVASAREFQQRNPRVPSISSSSTINSSSSAASVLHDIDVDWNDISIILNGLDSLIPLKLTPTNAFRASSSSMPINQESSMKLYKTKIQEKLSNSPSSSSSSSSIKNCSTSTKPRQGPHCEKFLKKIGLLKLDSSAESEVDHMCNHVNNYCRRWQFHLKKLLQVLSKAEDACIEVYLGPENNAILLEQWIFTLTDKASPSIMTIQSLCSAIRSQLYFSQISSWIDLLKKAFIDGDLSIKDQMPSLFCYEIMQNPRLKKNLQTMQVDLDILFRIKSYDGTSCFLEKPNIHKFPDTNISDGMAICVCLKSLPRLEKIPTLNTEKAHLNGFSCDNRIKSSSNVSLESSATGSSSRHIINDRMTYPSCHEKGKHRCKDEEDEIINDDECGSSSLIIEKQKEALSASNSNTNPTDLSSSSSSSSSMSVLTHRERQLLKYKKRLMKREKQKKKQHETSEQNDKNEKLVTQQAVDINYIEVPLYSNRNVSVINVSKVSNDDLKINEEEKTAIIVSNNNNNNYNSNNNSNKNNDNSKHALTTQLSIATQTDFNDTSLLLVSSSSSSSTSINSSMMMLKCDSCGNQLNLQCLNCDKVKLIINNDNANNFNKNQMVSPMSINNSLPSCFSAATGTMIGKKADLLLQAIERTAIAHQNVRDEKSNNDNIFSSTKSAKIHISKAFDSDAMSDCDKNLTVNNNNNNHSDSSIASSDCRLCKRQKTKHTPSMSIASPSSSSNGGSGNSYRRTMSECMVGLSPENPKCIYKSDENMYLSPIKMHNCDDSQISNQSSNMASEDDYNKFLSYGEFKSFRRAFSEDVINQLPCESFPFKNIEKNDDDDECITIKCHHEDTPTSSSSIHKLTPNVTLQQEKYYNFNRDDSLNQRIPKINLSQIFDNIQQTQSNIQNDSGLGHDDDSIDFSPTNDESVFTFNSPAKSYPPKMLLTSRSSPSAISKRRSRHMSDRSSISISEYCSDEDDDGLALSKCIPDKMQMTSSTKISSLYKKFVTKTQSAFNKFSKLPLLCTIEENLLHNRFQPKAIVEGFKLLLGASGSFCTQQITIPAAQTFFYEFQGVKHMSTPYVCEFRLARKYSIPRFGTVQATLLNPQGTVVRMFFVPYDFRDMPAMSQTFIRQRVLSLDEHINQKNAEQMCTSEQMKYLRYVINLRFQTGRSGRLCLHTDIKLVISRRTEFDTAQAHAKNSLESPNDLKTIIITPDNPKFSSRIDKN